MPDKNGEGLVYLEIPGDLTPEEVAELVELIQQGEEEELVGLQATELTGDTKREVIGTIAVIVLAVGIVGKAIDIVTDPSKIKDDMLKPDLGVTRQALTAVSDPMKWAEEKATAINRLAKKISEWRQKRANPEVKVSSQENPANRKSVTSADSKEIKEVVS
jgi:hypothetical protein